MRDAFKVIGKEIDYKGKTWKINEFYYVPNNPDIYVELFNGSYRMNVRLEVIKDLITTPYSLEQLQEHQ
jgi:hypothetical protein